MINQSKKRLLIERIKRLRVSGDKELLLSPDLYFDGYNDPHCTICANNSESISTSRFLARLREIQKRSDVSAVFVRFYDFSDAEEFEQCWIGSDSIYVVTIVSLKDVRDWFSDVWIESDYSKFVGLPKIPNGSKLIAVWWD